MLALVLRSILHFYRLLLPVALGVAVSSAVIVGALLVGDSMRGSLQHIAMDRIGKIERMVIAPRWFDQSSLARAESKFGKGSLHGLLFLQSVVAEHRDQAVAGVTHRATEMSLLGIDEGFWKLGRIQPRQGLGDQQIILNRALADKLQAVIGDRITIKVSRDAVVPADSALGKRENEVVILTRWEVVDIVPDESLGRFSLRSDQRPVMNAFASKESLQRFLELGDKVNAIASASQSSEEILPALELGLSDLGLRWQTVERVFPDPTRGEEAIQGVPPKTVYRYDQLTSEQMLIHDAIADAVVQRGECRRILSYLANGAEVIRKSGSQGAEETTAKGRSVPYSIISAAPWSLVSEMLKESGEDVQIPGDEDWVVIQRWMADQMQASVGDRIKIDYYLPETVEGTEVEKSFEATVIAIAPWTEPVQGYRRKSPARYDGSPTAFNDPAWTPVVPGITDQESISKWETPFPLTRSIEKQDDEYWNNHRLTPKLYVSESRGRELFGSRFGSQTGLRFEGLGAAERDRKGEEILEAARQELPRLGWRELPLRAQQIQASSGTTPFDALFLSLSFFVIAAALILVALLFRLTIERRADQWGLLMASGWTRGKVRSLLLLESAIVAAVGSALGVALGVGYAYAMLSGLKTWWVGAIAVSFLDFYIRPASLWIGWLAGFLVSLLTTWFVARRLRKVSVASLIRGRMEEDGPGSKLSRWVSPAAIACGVLGLIIMLVGQWSQGQAQAGAFVGSGMLWMVGLVLWLFKKLKSDRSDGELGSGIGIGDLARSNARRSPTRSILTVALMAMASFLILSMSLFQSQPDRRGTGGFAWLAKSAQSIHIQLADPKQQRLALGEKAEWLSDSQIVAVRVRGGDDASCNNLYQASEPQVMGIAPSIQQIDRGKEGESEFGWFSTQKRERSDSPWKALEEAGDGTPERPLPVILDQNTALWALHLGGYAGERFAYTLGDKKVHFRTVGVLQNTILQGSLWIGEENFERVFPDIGGYRMFLVKPKDAVARDPKMGSDSNRESIERMRDALEEGWSDEGLSCAAADGVLSKLLAVQKIGRAHV